MEEFEYWAFKFCRLINEAPFTFDKSDPGLNIVAR